MDTQLALFDFAESTSPVAQTAAPARNRRERTTRRGKRTPPPVFDLLDALESPVISYPSPWSSSVPGHVFENIPWARMVCLIKQQKRASLPELVAYMFPASMEFPLRREWAHVYLWVSGAYMRQYRGGMTPELEQALTDICPASLDREEQESLGHLSQWIYERRRKVLRARLAQRRKES